MLESLRAGETLPRGPHKLTREQVEDDQRRRLIKAMIAQVAETGYASSTVAQLIASAQVSRKTFYALFPSREALLLTAFEEASTWMLDQATKASNRTGGSTRRLEAALRKLSRCGGESPGSLALCTIEVAAVAHGGGFQHRQGMVERAGELLKQCLSTPHQPAVLPPLLSTAIAGAVFRVLDAQLRAVGPDSLTTTALELARWVRGYHPAPQEIADAPEHELRGMWPTASGHYGGRAPGTLTLDPFDQASTPSRASPSYVAHANRERILDAVARLTVEDGYVELTAQSIAIGADLSERAFLAQFASKDEAFAAACEIGHAKAQAIVARAREGAPTWRIGVQAALAGLFDFFASEPLYTNMALVGAPLASLQMAVRHNEQIAAYAQLLFHDAPQRRRPPAIAGQAIAHALFEIAYMHAGKGRLAQLPGALDQATYLLLAPFLGIAEAAKHALA